MGKVINFIKNYTKWIYLICSLSLILLFFLPAYKCTMEDAAFDYQNQITIYRFGELKLFKDKVAVILAALFCCLAILLCIFNLFFKSDKYKVLGIMFITMLCGFLIIFVSSNLGKTFYPNTENALLKYYYQPLSGYYLSICILIITLLTLLLDSITLNAQKAVKPMQNRIYKEKPLKSSERIEILELKLQVSELQKQIEELKKDG